MSTRWAPAYKLLEGSSDACKTTSISSSLSYSTFFEDLAAWPSWDETASADWPDAEPVAPVKQEAKTNTPWKDLQVTVDAKVKVAAEAAREHFLSYFYQHLPNSEIDWSMNGLYVCRVVGLSCCGNSFAKPVKLKLPLKTKADLMRECRDGTDKAYIVFRVFNVGSTITGLRLYVNPAELEEEGKLVFTESTFLAVYLDLKL
ncbi:sugar transport stp1 [Fusarium albosuccineum]|uniref:Sugar transport stp1 n=1 Tax=Fusarium albosuccineum TaxID=1237068 RepID=A0A8H4L9H1_9HYPO|nr:sugar transport stp1 [Fusarium albosuccineum]